MKLIRSEFVRNRIVLKTGFLSRVINLTLKMFSFNQLSIYLLTLYIVSFNEINIQMLCLC